MERIDLGPCPALLHEGGRPRCVVLLPGAHYPTRAPLLWFAREAALARGWSVLEVLDELPEGAAEPFEWALDRAERALDAAPGDNTLVVGKSLTSAATGLVADRGLPAVWLTPLMREQLVVDGLSRVARLTLLVGGSGDPLWSRETVPPNTAIETLELDGADHALQAPGDIGLSLAMLRQVTTAVAALLDRCAHS